jgi:hypothetical protein
MKVGFSTMFVQQDLSSIAIDNGDMCRTCVRIAQLAHVSVNNAETQSSWEQVVRDRACSHLEKQRRKDCHVMAEAVLSSQVPFFTSAAARFTKDQVNSSLSLSTESLSRSEYFCQSVKCCPETGGNRVGGNGTASSSSSNQKKTTQAAGTKNARAANGTAPSSSPLVRSGNNSSSASKLYSPSQVANLTCEKQRETLDADREQLNQDKAVLDKQEAGYSTRLNTVNVRTKQLDARESELNHREQELLKGKIRDEERRLENAMGEKRRLYQEFTVKTENAQRRRKQSEQDAREADEDAKNIPGVNARELDKRNADREKRLKRQKEREQREKDAKAAAKKEKDIMAKNSKKAGDDKKESDEKNKDSKQKESKKQSDQKKDSKEKDNKEAAKAKFAAMRNDNSNSLDNSDDDDTPLRQAGASAQDIPIVRSSGYWRYVPPREEYVRQVVVDDADDTQ